MQDGAAAPATSLFGHGPSTTAGGIGYASSLLEILDAECCLRSVFPNDADGEAYRAKIYASALGLPGVTFGRVSDQSWRVLVVRHGKRGVVGACCLSSRPSQRCSYLCFLGVSEAYRGEGIAKQLVTGALSSASGSYLYLTCHDELVPFYHRLGFLPMDGEYRNMPRTTQHGLHVMGHLLGERMALLLERLPTGEGDAADRWRWSFVAALRASQLSSAPLTPAVLFRSPPSFAAPVPGPDASREELERYFATARLLTFGVVSAVQFLPREGRSPPPTVELSEVTSETAIVLGTGPSRKREREQLSVYVSPENNGALVLSLLQKQAVQEISAVERWDQARFIWKPSMRGIGADILRRLDAEGGHINHFTQSWLLGSKDGLVRILSETQLLDEIAPATFVFRARWDVDRLMHGLSAVPVAAGGFQGDLWILKPAALYGGQGIAVCRLRDLPERLRRLGDKGRGSGGGGGTDYYVVQKYLEHPLLFQGRKFDLRLFMAVFPAGDRQQQLQVWMFWGGYARLASEKYSVEALDEKSLSSHLTNTCFQVSHGAQAENLHVELAEIAKVLQFDCNQLLGRVQRFLGDLFGHRCRPDLNPDRFRCSFELFGLDFILDEQKRPWLLEINTNCAIETNSLVTQLIVPEVVGGCLQIALEGAPRSEPPTAEGGRRWQLVGSF